MVEVRLDLNLDDWKQNVVRADMQRRAFQVLARAQVRAPVNTGHLRSSGRVEDSVTGGPYAFDVVFDARYSLFQDQGTGPIIGKNRPDKLLFFEIDGNLISTHRTRGVPATHFLSGALDAAYE